MGNSIMSTSPFYLQQFHRLNGSPAAGGKLRAFVQGTATPANLYLDAALTVVAPRPLLLDAQGYAPQFWVSPTSGLLMELRDADDTLIWTRDYVQATGSGSSGLVTSVAIDPPALMSVTGSPVTSAGTIALDWNGTAADVVLADGSTVAASSFAKADEYLPLAGGDMAPSAMISWPGQTNTGGFKGIYWQAPNCWSRISHWGAIWSPSSAPGERRGGVQLSPDIYGGSLSLRNPGDVPGVEIYTHENGGYARFLNFATGSRMEIGSHPSGFGEWFVKGSSGDIRVSASGYDGSLNAEKLAIGPVSYGRVVRIDATGAGYLTALSISGLSNRSIPLVSTAGGQLGDSSLSEDATSVKSAKPLTLNGATRPAWDADRNATQLDSLGSIWSSVSGVRLSRGMYYQGVFRAISATEYGSFISLGSDGGLEFASADALVSAGAVAAINPRVSASRTGALTCRTSEPVMSGITASTAGLSYSNSTTPTSIIAAGAKTIAAGRWGVAGTTWMGLFMGAIQWTNAHTLRFEVLLGATVIADSGAITMSAIASGSIWSLTLYGTLRTVGASGTLQIDGVFRCTESGGFVGIKGFPVNTPSPVAIDTTVSNTFNVRVTAGTASTGNILATRTFHLSGD